MKKRPFNSQILPGEGRGLFICWEPQLFSGRFQEEVAFVLQVLILCWIQHSLSSQGRTETAVLTLTHLGYSASSQCRMKEKERDPEIFRRVLLCLWLNLLKTKTITPQIQEVQLTLSRRNKAEGLRETAANGLLWSSGPSCMWSHLYSGLCSLVRQQIPLSCWSHGNGLAVTWNLGSGLGSDLKPPLMHHWHWLVG